MLLELVIDVTKLGLISGCLYVAFGAYLKRIHPTSSKSVERRRIALLLGLTLAVFGFKITEDALGGDSGPIDDLILRLIRNHVPGSLGQISEAITTTGSAKVLTPLTGAGTIVLLLARRRAEAALLFASVSLGALVVYLVKTLAGRARPSLADADLYWGSSFPSGHTLGVAAFSTAAVLCVARIWPKALPAAIWVAIAWVTSVGLSRLVLGVHWPTDVLAAACMGGVLPLLISAAIDARTRTKSDHR